MNNYYVAEYSVSQNAFHIETMNDLVKENLDIALNQLDVDFIPIGFFETELGASEFIEKVRNKLKENVRE